MQIIIGFTMLFLLIGIYFLAAYLNGKDETGPKHICTGCNNKDCAFKGKEE